ncbi:hypothetical protein SAMN05444169_1407 [Bradyrhizobium erythrophlei]|uniref:Uncharacterized protein n=1 Tax=Bradyrhizobium erythrophlei TaxID=1437360 RepID=A0A1M5I9Q3_9BRAD|nr:hypothetical protein SAMN05444169_1407 [Bradyrhizobium erythrophlei]
MARLYIPNPPRISFKYPGVDLLDDNAAWDDGVL